MKYALSAHSSRILFTLATGIPVFFASPFAVDGMTSFISLITASWSSVSR